MHLHDCFGDLHSKDTVTVTKGYWHLSPQTDSYQNPFLPWAVVLEKWATHTYMTVHTVQWTSSIAYFSQLLIQVIKVWRPSIMLGRYCGKTSFFLFPPRSVRGLETKWSCLGGWLNNVRGCRCQLLRDGQVLRQEKETWRMGSWLVAGMPFPLGTFSCVGRGECARWLVLGGKSWNSPYSRRYARGWLTPVHIALSLSFKNTWYILVKIFPRLFLPLAWGLQGRIIATHRT